MLRQLRAYFERNLALYFFPLLTSFASGVVLLRDEWRAFFKTPVFRICFANVPSCIEQGAKLAEFLHKNNDKRVLLEFEFIDMETNEDFQGCNQNNWIETFEQSMRKVELGREKFVWVRYAIHILHFERCE